jgi:hypothetical protein
MKSELLTCPTKFCDRRMCTDECCVEYNARLKERIATHGKCAGCKHWDEKPADAPWAGLPALPNVVLRVNPERKTQQALEHVCRRVGGFSSSGGYGSSPFGEDGKAAPSAYMLSRTCSAEFVTAADFGCVKWETRE